MIDVFREARERVAAEDAARHYGLQFDRRGWALCPFHHDRHPSMSFKNGRFRCWVCDVGGDCVDFTARLLGLDAMGAVRRLNEDFRLALPLDHQPTQAEQEAARRRQEIAELHKQFETWRRGFISRMNAAYRVGHLALKDCQDLDRLTEREALAIRWQACFEFWADALTNGTPEEQAQIYREREVINRWTEAVLKNC